MPEISNNASTKPIHSGHRQRMRNAFITGGGSCLDDHEIIEMLLYYSMPRVNTNDLAHKLLNEFGSLYNIITASPQRLMSIEGIGESTVIQIKLLAELYRRIGRNKYPTKVQFNNIALVGELSINHFKMDTNERLCAMMFDSSMHLLSICDLSCGGVNGTRFDTAELVKATVIKDASRVILAHNHPAGGIEPSISDILVTKTAKTALAAVGVPLIEHIVVNETGFYPLMHDNIMPAIISDESIERSEFYKCFYQY